MRQSLHKCRRCAEIAGATLVLLLGACGGGGGSSSGSTTQTGPRPPTASFTATPTDGLAPLQVSFDAAGSSDPDGTITGYQWDFGDDTATASGITVSHTYPDTGRFTVTLTVTDDDGQSDSATRTVQVRGATVSGVIRVAAGSGVDSDVNDEFTTPVANDSFGVAQAVSNPLRLGGFVNVAGSGAEDGNFTASGDTEDYYFVQLEGGERIVLSIGDPSADLDLELYDNASPPNLLDASVSPTPEEDFTEDLTAPAEPGGYFVRVAAVSGASNYILSISSETAPTVLRRRAKRLTDPFVPDELLMNAGAREPVRRYRIEQARGGRHHHVVRADRSSSARDMRLSRVPAAPGSTLSPALQARYRTLIAARDANRDPQVATAEVNVLRQPLRVPDDDFYEFQWHYPAIELEQAWDLTTGAEPGNPDVVVAVVDTGVLLDHPDLSNQLLRDDSGQVVGFDFIQDPARANDGDGLDPDPDDPGDDGRGPGSGSFHGTHVAGTVAADSDNGIGVAGVSWEARLMPLRALGIDGGTTFDVMQAVRYAAGLSNTSGTTPPRRADIINLSLGSDFYSETEQATLNEVRAAGVFVVASAGNGASDVPSYPAAYDGVLSVAASTISGTQAPYSNFGATIDLAAPGGDFSTDLDNDQRPDGVLSTLGEQTEDGINFGAAFLQGTSMAAPHVAGVIALMKAVYPGLRPGEFDALLESGALTDEAGVAGRDDQFGWGIINARKAVETAVASGDSTAGPVLTLSTGTLNFQAFTRELEFTVDLLGDGPVNVTVTTDQPWVSASQPTPSAGGLGPYRVIVERADLTPDRYSATITVEADNPAVLTRTVSVLMEVASTDVDADAGQHYVILVDPAGEESLSAQIVTAQNGEYTFSLRDVPPGEYRLFAGTDLDNDNFICDGGEACGAFPSLSSPAIISVDARQQAELSEQDFVSEFRTTATTTAAGASAADSRDAGLRVSKGPAGETDNATTERVHEPR